MIIDLILNRKDGVIYSAAGFYREVRDYGEIGNGIIDAMDAGKEIDVKKALAQYIVNSGYNIGIIDYIESVPWIVNVIKY